RASLRTGTAMRPVIALRRDFEPCAKRAPRRCTCARIGCGSEPSEPHDDLAEDLPAFEAREAALELGERDLGVDHGAKAGRHLGEALADIAQRGPKRADDAVLLLEELHQVERGRRPRGRPAGDQTAAALEAQKRAVEG